MNFINQENTRSLATPLVCSTQEEYRNLHRTLEIRDHTALEGRHSYKQHFH